MTGFMMTKRSLAFSMSPTDLIIIDRTKHEANITYLFMALINDPYRLS